MGSDRGGRGRSRLLSTVDKAMEEEPEDTLNEGASIKGAWFAPCVCACISHCHFHSSNERHSAMVSGGSIGRGQDSRQALRV